MNIQAKVLNIMALGMTLTAEKVAHVFVHYSGHVDTLTVDAHPADTVYSEDSPKRIYLVDKIIDLKLGKYNSEASIHAELDEAEAALNALRARKGVAA